MTNGGSSNILAFLLVFASPTISEGGEGFSDNTTPTLSSRWKYPEHAGTTWWQPVIPVTEVIFARAPRALEGEVKGGSSLEGAGKGGCGVKVVVRG